jgi:gliding motility-associated protein GldC
MEKQSISINVTLDPSKMPEHIEWAAPGAGTLETPQPAKALLLSLWDGEEKTAMRIDLWTKRMMVDEMNDFFVQTLLTLGDTYAKATQNEDLGNELKEFAANFKKKADAKIIQQEQK